LVPWPADRLDEILSRIDDWDFHTTLQWGYSLLKLKTFLTGYMDEHGTWPSPIIALDNRQGLLTRDPLLPASVASPHGYLLVEGHRRHAIACAMNDSGQAVSGLEVWVMSAAAP